MKKIVLLLMLVILSGCSVKYELNISNSYLFKEKISVNGKLTDFGGTPTKEFVLEYVDNYLYNADNYEFDKKEADDNNYNFVISGKTKGKANFLKAISLKYLYNDSNIYLNDNNNMVFELKRIVCDKEDGCDYLVFDNIDIIIDSDKEIINSNADEINGKKHIWHLKDSKIKDIYFELTDKTVVSNIIYYIIGGILFVIVVIFLIFIFKSKKSNAI